MNVILHIKATKAYGRGHHPECAKDHDIRRIEYLTRGIQTTTLNCMLFEMQDAAQECVTEGYRLTPDNWDDAYHIAVTAAEAADGLKVLETTSVTGTITEVR